MYQISAIFLIVFVIIHSSEANPNPLLTPDYTKLPTLRGRYPFNATNDADVLRFAMEGIGTDEAAIVEVMTRRSETQRYLIEQAYNNKYDRDLMTDLKDELTGCLEDIIVGLLEGPTTYLVGRLHKALTEGWSVDKRALIDIIAPRDNVELTRIAATYDEQFDTSLAEELSKDSSNKHWRRLLMALIKESSTPRDALNTSQATVDANVLYNSGTNMETIDENTFNTIMTRRSARHLREVFKEYTKKAGRSIEEAIKVQTSGPMRDTLMAIAESAQNRAVYFAKRLHEAMDGIGTDEAALRRILVSRAETDLGNIKMQYERLYDRTLASHIESEMSGDSRTAMLNLLG